MRTSTFFRVCKIESKKLISSKPELKAVRLPGLIQYNEGLKIQEEFSNLKQPVWSFFKEGTEVVRDVERFLKFHFQRDSYLLQNM